MKTMRAFTVGEHITHRSVDREASVIMTVTPHVVVCDGDDLIAAYLPAGAVGRRRSGQRGGGPRGRQLLKWDGGHHESTWTRTDVLMIHRPGDGFSLWSAWDASDRRPAWWYINLEEPWRRTSIGFDSRDLWLDLWRGPEEPEWHWKDEDELKWAIEVGSCSPSRAAAIRDEGERALDLIAKRRPPFDRDWAAWQPDPDWTVPVLSSEWKVEPIA